MSILRERLKAIKLPALPASLTEWYLSLDEEDRKVALEALNDADLKNYTLYGIFRDAGLRCSKDTFINFRKGLLAGSYTEDDLNGTR